MKTIENRLGYIDVTIHLLKQETGVFKWFNPLHIEEKFYKIKRMLCASELFDEVEEGEEIPDYEVMIHTKWENEKNCIDTVTVKRK